MGNGCTDASAAPPETERCWGGPTACGGLLFLALHFYLSAAGRTDELTSITSRNGGHDEDGESLPAAAAVGPPARPPGRAQSHLLAAFYKLHRDQLPRVLGSTQLRHPEVAAAYVANLRRPGVIASRQARGAAPATAGPHAGALQPPGDATSRKLVTSSNFWPRSIAARLYRDCGGRSEGPQGPKAPCTGRAGWGRRRAETCLRCRTATGQVIMNRPAAGRGPRAREMPTAAAAAVARRGAAGQPQTGACKRMSG